MKRILYIDNLRILLTCLVVLHHLCITYGGPGDWYYNEGKPGMAEFIPMILFVTANQSFFMGMFFLISAFFTVPSLERKGPAAFLRDRLIRLGIPLLVFYFVISPVTIFLLVKYIYNSPVGFIEYITAGKGRGFGPMWFVEALLIFSLVYLALGPLLKKFIPKGNRPLPGPVAILLFALLTGIGQYVIRIWLSIGWTLPFTNFQLPFFLQYILWFGVGIIARKFNWLDAITLSKGRQWFLAGQVLIFAGLPLLLWLGKILETGTDTVVGGGTWQSFYYAVWEQVTGISLMIGLFGLASHFFNHQGKGLKLLSESAYTAYIIHPAVLVAMALLFREWGINPLLKFILLAPVALAACFSTAWLIRQIPGFKKVL